MREPTPRIGVVDDDPGMLKALNRLLSGNGYSVQLHSSPDEFLEELRPDDLDCLLLDLQMPDMDGLSLQARLKSRGVQLPVVFLSGEGDIPSSVQAIKGGAVNFLTKPVDREDLIESIERALSEGEAKRAISRRSADLRARFESLTNREKEVYRHVISGQLNKQIAADLGISLQTVKVHRMHITEKMGMPSVAELVWAAESLGIAPLQSMASRNDGSGNPRH